MKKTLILINGYKRSGKDYMGSVIKDHYGEHKCKTVSFAEPIKQILADTLDISLEDLEEYKNNDSVYGLESKCYPDNQPSATLQNYSYRELLQRLGTEALKKQFGDNIWAKLGIKRIKKSKSKINLITDFRFMSEYKEALKQAKKGKFNLITINIFNKDIKEGDMHISETELRDNNFKFDYYVDNTGQPDISIQVESILKDLN